MNSLQEAFGRFAATLQGDPGASDPAQPSQARELLSQFRDDPGFWLRYAEICRAHDDFQEAFAALECVDRALEAHQQTLAASPITEPVLEAFRWRRDRCATELLKLAARGDPRLQPELIRSLRALAAQNREAISAGLGAAQAAMETPAGPGQAVDARWERHLARLAMDHRPGPDADFRVYQDFATALLGGGKFGEAEQLLDSPAYLQLTGGHEALRKERQWLPQLVHWIEGFLENPFRQVAPFTGAGHRYVLAMVVWGEAFLDSLERFTFPSLMAHGNLPYLGDAGEAHLLLFTTRAGAERLERMPVFAAVKAVVGVDVVCFPDQLMAHCDTYKLMSSMHLAGLAAAKASQAHFFFLAPDIVVADNFLEVADRRLKQGAEVVFAPGLMLQLESFGEDLAGRFPAGQMVLSIPPMDLLSLGMRHVHPFVMQTYVYAPIKRRPSASVLLWPLRKGGLLAHCFHHSPFLVSAVAVQRFEESLFFTIDGEFLLKIIHRPEQLERCVLLADTSETNYFELSRGSRYDFPIEFDMTRMCRWGVLQGFVARWLFPQKVCFDPSGTGADDPAHQAAAKVVDEALRGMADMIGRNPLPLPDAPLPSS